MKHFFAIRRVVCFGVLALVAALVPQAARAQVTYNAYVGAETKDQSVQADGFFPNELWVLEGDSIKWTFVPENEPHTFTLLTPGQVRPAFQAANCGAGPDFNGSACVSSASLNDGATFTVTFPAGSAGNYKFVCLIHTDMNGTVHVLVNNAANAALIHSKQFYEDEARDEANDILADRDNQREEVNDAGRNAVLAGTGEIVATGGGTSYRAVVRFLNQTIRIHKGESVEWTNVDPTEPHTVTFGTEPANLVPTMPIGLNNPPAAADGTLIGTIDGPNDFLNSGFIVAQAPDRRGLAQLPPGTTRIRITFTNPGIFQYHCALHDTDGMVGTVVVLP